MASFSITKRLKNVIKICSDNNIKKIKIEGIEIEFGDRIKTTVEMPTNFENIKSEKMPTDEEFLFMSTQFNVDKPADNKDPFEAAT